MIPRSLRNRVALFFTAASVSVAGLFATSTYWLTTGYLLDQRTTSAQRRVTLDAPLVHLRLGTADSVPEALAAFDLTSASVLVVHRDGRWSSSSPDVDEGSLPADLVRSVASGRAAQGRVTSIDGQDVVVAGTGFPDGDGELFEVTPLDELNRTMTVLAAVLAGGTAVAAVLGLGIALWGARRLLAPLDDLAAAAAEIADGELSLRLGGTRDRDLGRLVSAFNRMVDALQARIERDARFAADVSHELRTPLTTLVASVDVLAAGADGMSDRQRHAVELAEAELLRFRRMLDELIELARFDAGVDDAAGPPFDLHQLVVHAVRSDGRDPDLVTGRPGALVRGDKRRLVRAVRNLLENADKYAGGPVEVAVVRQGGVVDLRVDDAGPGVPERDRDRIFARFATRGDGRGSAGGTGLGLAIVQQTAASLGGRVNCLPRPGGGARFVIRLPVAPDDE